MGPQLDSCGRYVKDDELLAREGLLQWGRNLIVAEGRPPTAPKFGATIASMGPQLDSCGRYSAAQRSRSIERLQWGRNLIVAEGRA